MKQSFFAATRENNFNIYMSCSMRTVFCCCMHGKIVRNKSKLFKETTGLVNLVSYWSACKCNNMQTHFSKLCQHTTTMFIVHCLDHWAKKRATGNEIYSKYYTMRSGVTVLARKIYWQEYWQKWWNYKLHYNLDPMVLTKKYRITCFLLNKLFFILSVV